MPDLHEPAGELDPGRPDRRPPDLGTWRLIGWEQWVDRKDMLDVHQDQLLMLLLVVNPELEQGCSLAPSFRGCLLDEPGYRRIDMIAIRGDDIDGRTRQQPALRSRMTRAGGLII